MQNKNKDLFSVFFFYLIKVTHFKGDKYFCEFFSFLRKLFSNALMVSLQTAPTIDQMAESQELFTAQVLLRAEQTTEGIIPIIQWLFWRKNMPFASINNALHHLSFAKGGHLCWVTAGFWEIALRRYSKMPAGRQASGFWKSGDKWVLVECKHTWCLVLSALLLFVEDCHCCLVFHWLWSKRGTWTQNWCF